MSIEELIRFVDALDWGVSILICLYALRSQERVINTQDEFIRNTAVTLLEHLSDMCKDRDD